MAKPSLFAPSSKTSPEILRLVVMLCIRFPLSLRKVDDLKHERGVGVSHETVWFWWHCFGLMFASEIRKRRIEGMRSSRWRWHLDEMFLKIDGDPAMESEHWPRLQLHIKNRRSGFQVN